MRGEYYHKRALERQEMRAAKRGGALSGGIEEVKEYPLSDADIQKLLGGTSIFTYPELANMSHIDECFDDKGRAIMLFLTTGPAEGHWICMLKKGDTIEYFDPYGEAPEQEKKWLSKEMLEKLGQDEPYLKRLMAASGYKIIVNKHKFQKDGGDINTCGRHCVVRCLYAPYSLAQYAKVIKSSGMSPDDFVGALTADMLKK